MSSSEYLARGISLAKWNAERNHNEWGLGLDEISADAVTVDLRTKNNNLSLWKCGDATVFEIEEVALALVAANKHVDKLDLAWIHEDDLRRNNQNYMETTGETPAIQLANKHIDVVQLDYSRLGTIAHCVRTAIDNGQCIRVPKPRVREILVEAVRQNRIALDDLQERVQAEVGRFL